MVRRRYMELARLCWGRVRGWLVVFKPHDSRQPHSTQVFMDRPDSVLCMRLGQDGGLCLAPCRLCVCVRVYTCVHVTFSLWTVRKVPPATILLIKFPAGLQSWLVLRLGPQMWIQL